MAVREGGKGGVNLKEEIHEFLDFGEIINEKYIYYIHPELRIRGCGFRSEKGAGPLSREHRGSTREHRASTGAHQASNGNKRAMVRAPQKGTIWLQPTRLRLLLLFNSTARLSLLLPRLL